MRDIPETSDELDMPDLIDAKTTLDKIRQGLQLERSPLASLPDAELAKAVFPTSDSRLVASQPAEYAMTPITPQEILMILATRERFPDYRSDVFITAAMAKAAYRSINKENEGDQRYYGRQPFTIKRPDSGIMSLIPDDVVEKAIAGAGTVVPLIKTDFGRGRSLQVQTSLDSLDAFGAFSDEWQTDPPVTPVTPSTPIGVPVPLPSIIVPQTGTELPVTYVSSIDSSVNRNRKHRKKHMQLQTSLDSLNAFAAFADGVAPITDPAPADIMSSQPSGWNTFINQTLPSLVGTAGTTYVGITNAQATRAAQQAQGSNAADLIRAQTQLELLQAQRNQGVSGNVPWMPILIGGAVLIGIMIMAKGKK